MTQHSWYNKNRRHYGRKPNTRRERGLKRRDYGKKHIIRNTVFENLEEIKEQVVEEVTIPRSMSILKKYIRIYNLYVHKYQLYRDKSTCIKLVMEKYGIKQKRTIEKAIKVCKYIIATVNEDSG